MAEDNGRQRRLLLILGIVLVASAVMLVWQSGTLPTSPTEAAARIRQISDAWWAPAVFVAVYTLLSMALIPSTALSIAAAVAWGWFGGGLVELIAVMVAAVPTYAIGTTVSEGWLHDTIKRRSGQYLEKLHHEEFVTMLLLRLVPVLPFPVINYAAGLLRINPRVYFVTTLFGTIPSVFIFTYLVDSIVAGLMSPTEAGMRVFFAGVLFGALVIISRLIKNRYLPETPARK